MEVRPVSASLPSGPLIQIAVLDELIGGDPELRKDFLNDYSGLLRDVRVAIESAYATADWPAVKAGAHKLKSSSFSLGMPSMGNHCKYLETVNADTPAGDSAEAVRYFQALADAIDGELRTYLE